MSDIHLPSLHPRPHRGHCRMNQTPGRQMELCRDFEEPVQAPRVTYAPAGSHSSLRTLTRSGGQNRLERREGKQNYTFGTDNQNLT